MMSKISSVRFHPAFRLYRYSVKRTMGLTVLMTVFLMLICPGYVFMHINHVLKLGSTDMKVYDLNRDLPTLILIVTVITTAAAILYLFINFAFLYGRSSSDFFHSLPLNRRSLLASRFFAGIVPVLMPMTLTYAAMCGLLAIDYISGNIRLILWGFVYNILILLMSCAFSMIFIVASGSVFDLIISFFTFNIGIAVVQLINQSFCEVHLFGFPRGEIPAFFTNSSPFIYAFVTFSELMNGSERTPADFVIFTARLLFVTAASLVAAFLLYSRRKSEKSGVSYAYRFLYVVCALIVGVIGAYALGTIFAGDQVTPVFWVFAVIGGMLAAVTFGAVNDRGFKSFKKSLVIGGCSAALIGTLALFLWSGAFGYSSRIPEKESVKSVSVAFGQFSVEFDDPSLVIDLHKKITEQSGGDGYGEINISYKLKFGALKRTYFVDYNDFSGEFLKIIKSEENIKSIRNSFDKFIGNNLSISLYDQEYWSDSVQITASELKGLEEAYVSDIPSATDELLSGNLYMSCDITGLDKEYDYCYYELHIEDNFKNTIEYLESLDLEQRVDAGSTETYAED